MLNNTFVLAAILLLSPFLQAQPAQTLEAANKDYQDKEYEAAIQKYEEVLQRGYGSEALYYNLGNAYYKNGQAGRAVLNYQRALQLDPQDKNTLHNLEVVRAGLPEPPARIQPSGVVEAWLSVQNALSSQSWSIIGLAMVWLAAAGLAIWLLGGARRRAKLGLAGGVVILTLSILPFLLAYGRSRQEFFSTRAVVMVQETPLRAAPEEESKELQKLYEGATVEILDALEGWNKVRLEDTSEGWLPEEVVEGV